MHCIIEEHPAYRQAVAEADKAATKAQRLNYWAAKRQAANEQAVTDYQERVNAALDAGEDPPTDAPVPLRIDSEVGRQVLMASLTAQDYVRMVLQSLAPEVQPALFSREAELLATVRAAINELLPLVAETNELIAASRAVGVSPRAERVTLDTLIAMVQTGQRPLEDDEPDAAMFTPAANTAKPADSRRSYNDQRGVGRR